MNIHGLIIFYKQIIHDINEIGNDTVFLKIFILVLDPGEDTKGYLNVNNPKAPKLI